MCIVLASSRCSTDGCYYQSPFCVEGKRFEGWRLGVSVIRGKPRNLATYGFLGLFVFFLCKVGDCFDYLKMLTSKHNFQLFSLLFIQSFILWITGTAWDLHFVWENTASHNNGCHREWNPRLVHLGPKRVRNQETEGPPSKVVSPFRQPIPQAGPTGLHQSEASGVSYWLVKKAFQSLE